MKERRIYPVNFSWHRVDVTDADGVVAQRLAMTPEARYAGIAERQFFEGEIYTLVPLEARSRGSHNHYFAALEDGYQNLPEGVAKAFPSAEYLRHWILIETNWCEDDIWHLTTRKEAERRAARTRSREPFARMRIFETKDDDGRRCWALQIRRAMSQSAAAMGKAEFEKSKTDVLDYIATLVGTSRKALAKEAGRHA
jgi:hypothetical protein